ncbi:protein MIZU-KUSSEI 1-like [Pyrus x bretschneideri]|uniref:protein MIZU-KUSSEI 1-like n=1 Tax=Pyrus x bretschneideri TaxID=225117 RepID=UPI0020306705|nr:protein MIZU-KUSSEI 1-like [Pyrus x bretschneideri]
MTKINALHRFLLPCFSPNSAKSTRSATVAPKKRLSTSLRDDLDDINAAAAAAKALDPQDQDSQSSTSPTPQNDVVSVVLPQQPRPSKSMVIGTIFGHRRGHVWLCIQHDRRSTKPTLLLELSVSTHQLVNEMQLGLVRVTLECNESDRPQLIDCPLLTVPIWTVHCNGRKFGFAARRKASEKVKLMLKLMQSMTVGAGVMPAGFALGSEAESHQEVMYMRANYDHVVGSADSESFHLINPDQCPSQELSVFLLRSRHS